MTALAPAAMALAIAGEADTAVSDNRNPGAFQRFLPRRKTAVIRGTPTPVTIRVVQMSRVRPTFTALQPLPPARACASGDVAADDLQVRIFKARVSRIRCEHLE